MNLDSVGLINGWVSGVIISSARKTNRGYKLITNDESLVRAYRQALASIGVEVTISGNDSNYQIFPKIDRKDLDNKLLIGSGTGTYYHGWLIGVIDAKGHIRIIHRKNGKVDYYIEVCSKRKVFINILLQRLSMIGINYRFTHNKKLFRVRISRKIELLKLIPLLNLQVDHKLDALEELRRYITRTDIEIPNNGR